MNRFQLLISTLALGISLSFALPARAMAPMVHREIVISDFVMALHQPKMYASTVLKKKGWNKQEYACLVKLWNRESHWNYKAKNPHSTAFGIGQLLIETSHDPSKQIRNGIRYLEYRYGSACKAWSFWQKHYYY